MTFAGFSPRLIPTTARTPGYARAASSRTDISSRQTGHQVAQKCTSTTRPLKDDRATWFPCRSGSANSKTGSPGAGIFAVAVTGARDPAMITAATMTAHHGDDRDRTGRLRMIRKPWRRRAGAPFAGPG